MREWYRRHRFLVAYRILRNISERHRDAGHHVRFRVINEAYIHLECYNCPDFRIPASLDGPDESSK
jgi:hypothetical protein